MVKKVDTVDSKSTDENHTGSNPVFGTKIYVINRKNKIFKGE